MKRIIFFSYLLFTSFFCFAQQSLPAKIIGGIPAAGSDKMYQIQVGAYLIRVNADEAVAKLKNFDLLPVTEKFRNFTRVLVKEIPASEIRDYLANIAKAGFTEVIIREDTPSIKREINPIEPEVVSSKRVIDSIEPEITPTKKEIISTPSDLLSRTWKIDSCPNKELTGSRLFVLNNGTYYITNSKGESSSLSNWRWNGDYGNDFEYTHNDWEYYGRAEIINITDDSLELLDSGYSYDAPGRSSAGYSNRWVFTAVP